MAAIPNTDTFDFIVVGAGSVGCVLAGGYDRSIWIHVPLGYGKLFSNPKVNWLYTAVGYLRQAHGRPNLTIVPNALASRILFKTPRHRRRISARRYNTHRPRNQWVVVAGGPFNHRNSVNTAALSRSR